MANGSCICNAVQYSFTGEPAMQVLCHCIPCRKISGGPYTTNLIMPLTSLTITSGSSLLKTFSLAHPTGMTLKYHFCETCGTKMYKEGDQGAFVGMAIVQAGTLDGGEGNEMGVGDVKLGAELWVKERVKWLGAMEGIAQCAGFS
jgi:hypothetical protein